MVQLYGVYHCNCAIETGQTTCCQLAVASPSVHKERRVIANVNKINQTNNNKAWRGTGFTARAAATAEPPIMPSLLLLASSVDRARFVCGNQACGVCVCVRACV